LQHDTRMHATQDVSQCTLSRCIILLKNEISIVVNREEAHLHYDELNKAIC